MHTLHESLSILRLLHLEYNAGTLLGYANDAGFKPKPSPFISKVNRYDHDGNIISRECKSFDNDGKGYMRARVVRDSFPLLPKTFLGSKDFERWRDEYYDIVVLGGTHRKL